jgi:hypothetical protein
MEFYVIISTLINEPFGRFEGSIVAFSQYYVEHDLRKNKIVVPFFCRPINFYELIVWF